MSPAPLHASPVPSTYVHYAIDSSQQPYEEVLRLVPVLLRNPSFHEGRPWVTPSLPPTHTHNTVHPLGKPHPEEGLDLKPFHHPGVPSPYQGCPGAESPSQPADKGATQVACFLAVTQKPACSPGGPRHSRHCLPKVSGAGAQELPTPNLSPELPAPAW